MTARQRFSAVVKSTQVDAKLGVVFGFAIVCKDAGGDYFDLQGEHVPEAVMLEAAAEFAKTARPVKAMHAGEDQGSNLFVFPLTSEVAKALNITSTQTGLLIGMQPSPAVMAKFQSGEYKGFSIGGWATYEDVPE